MRLAYQFAFVFALSVWTWLLLKPHPVPEFINASLLDDVKFILGKLLHLSAYLFLAVFGTYAVPKPYWQLLWIGLVLHGGLSELGQQFGDLWYQTHRTGTVRDVVIDTVGVMIGRWWTRCKRNPFTQSIDAPSLP